MIHVNLDCSLSPHHLLCYGNQFVWSIHPVTAPQYADTFSLRHMWIMADVFPEKYGEGNVLTNMGIRYVYGSEHNIMT